MTIIDPPVRSYEELLKKLRSLERPWVKVRDIGWIPSHARLNPYPILEIRMDHPDPKANRPHRPVLVSAGIHGDEPAGVLAILNLLERAPQLPSFYHDFSITLLPCSNPYGYEHHQRENSDEVDLNRCFRDPTPPKEVDLIRQMAQGPYEVSVEFHEDIDSPGIYLYELIAPEVSAIGEELIDHLAKRYPINRNSEIEGMPADQGVISRNRHGWPIRLLIERWRQWPQALYHFSRGTSRCYTTETPTHLSMDERAEIHLIALDFILRRVWENPRNPAR